MQQPPRLAFPPLPPPIAGPIADSAQLDRQLDSIIHPTTVEDLARKGGPIKAVKERELRELIRQSLLHLLEDPQLLSAADQERILDRVQGELRQVVGQRPHDHAESMAREQQVRQLNQQLAQSEAEQAERAEEFGMLRAQLADAESLISQHAESLNAHLALASELLADHPAAETLADPLADLIARIRNLRDARQQDQAWLGELQKRQVILMTEREAMRSQLEAELDRSVQAEVRNDELSAQLAALEQRLAEKTMLAEPEPALVAELTDLREALSETQARLDVAETARLRVERELASASTGRAAAERRGLELESELAASVARTREVEALLTDQRRTTDVARLASVEAEALRAEISMLRLRADQDATAVADERAASQRERDKHRAENLARVEAMRRVETALTNLRAQLAERERELTVVRSELATRRAEAVPVEGSLEAQLAAVRAELKTVIQERDWLRTAVLARQSTNPDLLTRAT